MKPAMMPLGTNESSIQEGKRKENIKINRRSIPSYRPSRRTHVPNQLSERVFG